MRAPGNRATCSFGTCPAPALAPAETKDMLGPTMATGMCPLHTMHAVMVEKRRTLPVVHAEYHDATAYAEWVNAASASGTVRYKGLTVNDLRQTELAKMLGVHRVTVSRLANGHLSKVRKPVATALNPFVAFADTTPAWSVRLGQPVGAPEVRYAPLGTVLVDYYGRAWQLRGKADNARWCPAHVPDPRPSRSPGSGRGAKITAPSYPARVVHLPPRIYDELTTG